MSRCSGRINGTLGGMVGSEDFAHPTPYYCYRVERWAPKTPPTLLLLLLLGGMVGSEDSAHPTPTTPAGWDGGLRRLRPPYSYYSRWVGRWAPKTPPTLLLLATVPESGGFR